MSTTIIPNGEYKMPKLTSHDEVKTNIRVPVEKYLLLKDIKDETGKPINALVVEGVDLLLIKYRDILDKAVERAEKKAQTVQDILKEIE